MDDIKSIIDEFKFDVLLLLRHGQTDDNVGDIVQGQRDVPLNATGRQQAEHAGQQLKALMETGLIIDRIITSHLSRALETSRISNRYLKLPLLVDEDFSERNYGAIQGHSRKVYDNPAFEYLFIPGAFDKSERKIAIGAELETEVALRVAKALLRHSKDFLGETFLVISHRGVFRPLADAMTGRSQSLDNATPYRLQRTQDNSWQLAKLNTDS